MCLQLEQLGRAGVPLMEALADVRDSTESAKLRDILTGVYESVKGGTVLSDALSAYPKEFDDVFVGLVKAGEKTGDMSEVYHHLSEHFKWTYELKPKLSNCRKFSFSLIRDANWE